MTSTMTQETPQSQSPGNTPTCRHCQEAKRLYKDGSCLGCYGLSVISMAAWPDGTPTWVTCPKCGVEWSKLIGEMCFDCDAKAFEKLAMEKRNQERLIKIFGSIKTANHFTFLNFKTSESNQEAFDKCKDFQTARDNLYLWGPCGTGKTHLAYAAAKVHFLHGKKVIITSPMRMVDTFRTKSELDKEDRMQEFSECELLLIDDFGISKYTDFAIEILCELLNRRSLQMKNGLIVTSNLSMDALSQKNKDDRITSRLSGLCSVISVGGADFRTNRFGG